MTVLPGPALLFCPGDRPDRYGKAAAAADGVIIDLEDAVATAAKAAARAALMLSHLDPERTIVRLNPAGTADFETDLAAVARTGYTMVMLAKTESAADIRAVPTGLTVVALCETARGVAAAEEIAGVPSVVALMWGAEDLVASIGGTSSRFTDGSYRDVARYARSRVLIAAAAHGKAAIDAVHLDIPDLAGLTAEATDAAAVGFAATACIHPTQVGPVREAYRPDADRLAWARAVLAAAAMAPGVFRFDDQMIDGPILAQARVVVARSR